MLVKIYTDGAARGNPDGPGGYGCVLHYTDRNGNLHEKELSAGYKKTTNNRMELMAAIVGLEALNRPCQIQLYSDSKYLVDAFNQHWIDGWIKKGWKRGKNELVKNVDLWKRLLQAKEPHQVEFIWVKGHDGHEMNERCDYLATSAADGDNLLVDRDRIKKRTCILIILIVKIHVLFVYKKLQNLSVSTGKSSTDPAAVIAWCDSHDTVKDFRIIAGTGEPNL